MQNNEQNINFKSFRNFSPGLKGTDPFKRCEIFSEQIVHFN